MSDLKTDPPQPPVRTGMKRWLKVVLFASLALNLAVIGLVIGAVLHGPPGPDGRDRARAPSGMAFPYTRAFSDEAQGQLRRDYIERMRVQRAEQGGREPTYPEVLALLRADPFDRAAFEAVLLRQFTRVEVSQAVGREVLLDRIATMSAADRSAYADRLEESLNRRRGKHDGRAPRDADRP